jgi:undecaprenyl-diphosphatase
MPDIILQWDKVLFLFFNRDIANPVFDVFFKTITNAKFWIIPGVAAALFFLKTEKKRALPVLLLSVVTVCLTDQLAASFIKPFVHRLRPCNLTALVEGGRFLLGNNPHYSFPSNHAMNMFGQATLLSFFYPRHRIWFFLFAATIAFSRVYVGLHYPLDVFAGAVFGVVCGLLVIGLYKGVVIYLKKKRSIQNWRNAAAPRSASRIQEKS